MEIAISAAAALVPSLLMLRWFYVSDKRPEPHRVLIVTFLLGCLIVVPLLVLGIPIYLVRKPLDDPWLEGLVHAFLFAAIPEEVLKCLVLLLYCMRHPAFNEPMDGVVYGATVSLGFASLENVLYVIGGGWTTAVVRALTAVPMHASVGAVLGFHAAWGRFVSRDDRLLWRGLGIAILLHGLYDYPLLTLQRFGVLAEQDPTAMPPLGVQLLLIALTLTVLISTVVWTNRIVRLLRRRQESQSE
jgi:RsiW-degrading membrane proteinase PrsW (M82 family)